MRADGEVRTRGLQHGELARYLLRYIRIDPAGYPVGGTRRGGGIRRHHYSPVRSLEPSPRCRPGQPVRTGNECALARRA